MLAHYYCAVLTMSSGGQNGSLGIGKLPVNGLAIYIVSDFL